MTIRENSNTHASDWSQAPQATKILALLAAMFILAGVWLIYFSDGAYEQQGPVSLAQNPANEILIGTYSKLFLVDAHQRLHNFQVKDIGVTGSVNSIHVEQGSWLLGDDGSGMLLRCTADLSSCKPRFNFAEGKRMFNRAHGVAFLGDKLAISDSDRHRLRVFDHTGKEVVTTRTEPIGLCYPNDVLALDGYLYVVDSNNLRIVRVDPQHDFHSEPFITTYVGRPFDFPNCTDLSSNVVKKGDAYVNMLLDTEVSVGRTAKSPARADHDFPATLLHSSRNEWWVIQMTGHLRYGDVILYTKDGQPFKRVALPAGAEPTSMLETSFGVLIADSELARIYLVSLDGAMKGEWGSQELRAEFQSILKKRAQLQQFYPIGWVLIVLGVICAILVVARELLRLKGEWQPPALNRLRPATVAPLALTLPEMWLDVDTAFARNQKIAAWLVIILGAATCSFFMFLIVKSFGADAASRMKVLLQLTVLLCTAIMGFVLTAGIIRRLAPRRIGTNGNLLLIDNGRNQILSCEFSDVLASGYLVLVDKKIMRAFNAGGKSIYPKEQFDSLILARIPQHNFVGSIRFVIESLRRGNLMVWGALILLIAAISIRLKNI